ncbi:hypothetical protein B0T26DRAFT_659649 [Lasiosphaeria miniovina]|uniref:N-acetyltransferase domain-containing protein n=1 Tax=Lasiosphaeria miniovina TaxID=1954250 RepID=A0AA39ZQK8_9PEZI|nr:uncharacterized protein B0T26DRAFT_659649 [Lasiosphaeria miniovina]KAK0701832.1 hypothetical protein B0T26DRAFT_659649 [Lasiosphaeria miniovina]
MTYIFSSEQHGHLVPYIAALHASCITIDHMIGPFLPPLTNEKLLPWWKERLAEANQGTRVIVLLLPETAPGAKPVGTDLRGLAMLRLSSSETASFRGRIDAVLVNQKYRRQGGAKTLVDALEYEAAKRGRTMLRVNTETGSVAEAAFKKFGYIEIGKVPQFSRVLSNDKKGETFFYKDLLP